MKPYFEASHLAGVLMLFVTMGWMAMEFARVGSTRDGATRIGGGGRGLTVVPALIGGTVVLYLAPHFVPAAAIRPGVAAFIVGLLVVVAGLVLRGWAIKTLGEYFTGRVMVSADQPVITAGPYRWVRHPSYTGLLLACAGLGLASANWVGVAAMVLLPLAAILWRIRAEEHALMASLGDPYRTYAAQHKRLAPLLW